MRRTDESLRARSGVLMKNAFMPLDRQRPGLVTCPAQLTDVFPAPRLWLRPMYKWLLEGLRSLLLLPSFCRRDPEPSLPRPRKRRYPRSGQVRSGNGSSGEGSRLASPAQPSLGLRGGPSAVASRPHRAFCLPRNVAPFAFGLA